MPIVRKDSLRHFLLPPGALDSSPVTVTGELFHHMAKVVRLRQGAHISLADSAGLQATGVISEMLKDSLSITLEDQPAASASDPAPRITLYQGLPKGDKMDLILQKATELGAAEIVPFMAERSVVRLTGDRATERLDRWKRIVREAARQCGRATVPKVVLADDLTVVISRSLEPVKLLLWEMEQTGRLKDILNKIPLPESIGIIIGPEGGLTSEEANRAASGGFIPVTLGKRIVRTETAGPAILAILQFYWGDIG